MALQHCQGELVTGLDDDDWFLPHRLRRLYQAYDDKYAFVCSGVIWDFGIVKGKAKRKRADSRAKVFNLTQQLSYNHATTQVLVSKSRLELGLCLAVLVMVEYFFPQVSSDCFSISWG